MTELKKYKIYAGLGGSFGGANLIDTIFCKSEYEAETVAREHALNIYESYEGLYGLKTWDDVREDLMESGEDFDDDIVSEYYDEEVEGWISYYAVEIEK